jgi:hypothetical protein
MAKWKVGKVLSVNIPGVDDAYGFTVFTEGGAPIVNFVYPTRDACESAAKHIGLALEGAVSVLAVQPPLKSESPSESETLYRPLHNPCTTPVHHHPLYPPRAVYSLRP